MIINAEDEIAFMESDGKIYYISQCTEPGIRNILDDHIMKDIQSNVFYVYTEKQGDVTDYIEYLMRIRTVVFDIEMEEFFKKQQEQVQGEL